MSQVQRLVRFASLAVVVALVLLALGYVPTRRLAGEEGITAMLAGLIVSLVASLLGALPLAAVGPETDPRTVPTRALASMLIRFVAILALGLAVALSGWFSRAPFLIWIALSHLVFLTVDTLFALRAAQGSGPSE